MSVLKMNDKSVDTYFGFLENLDARIKEHLIKMLQSSLKKERKPAGIKHLFGAWEDKRPTETIISELKDSRVDRQLDPGFE